MKCKNCGGTLSFANDGYQCESCGASFSLNAIYETFDVCICYQENDENGRRTKDSIISQDIFKKLESYKIKTYYSRISASEFFGDDLDYTNAFAIQTAKIIIIVGTTKERFDDIYRSYEEQYAGKIIIPVFSDMDPYNIPKKISALQALDYNKIGADIDLIKGVLNALGRGNEAELIGADKSKNTKRKKVIVVALVVLTVVLVVFSCFIISDKSTQGFDKGLTQSAKYNSAIVHFENGEFSEALSIFQKLSGYKDSDKQRQLIFDKYSGYYKKDNVSLHFQTYDNLTSSIDLSFLFNDNVVRITESIVLGAQETKFDFIDSENNFGDATINFTNEGLVIRLRLTQKNSDLFIEDQKIKFVLTDKSDKPIINIDAETIFSWVKNATTIEDIRRLGHEVSLEYSSPRMNVDEHYGIKNTDIKLFSIWDSTCITSILAPAELLIPDYIGKPGNQFYIDEVLVIPNATNYGNTFVPYGWENDDIITKDTPVLVVTETSFNAAVNDVGWGSTFDEEYGDDSDEDDDFDEDDSDYDDEDEY